MHNLVYILSDSESFKKEALAAFEKVGIPKVSIKLFSIVEASEKIPPSPLPAIGLLDISSTEKNLITMVHDVIRKSKDIRFIGAGTPSDVSLVMNLVKTGVKDFIGYPFKESELNDLILSLQANAPKVSKNARIVTVYSPKGGTGITLLAVNLAVALVRTNPDLKRATDPKPTLVVCDFSPQCGDISTYLNINPQYTIRDIIDNHTILDESFLQGVLLPHASGIQVLAAPRENQEPPNSNHLNIIKSTIQMLKTMVDYIVIDGGYLDRTLLQYVISESDLTFLVGNPDVVSLKGLVTFFNKLKDLKFDTDKIKILINRYNSKNQIDAREFEKMLKHPITATLPNNYMLCIEAVNSGQTLSSIQDKSDLVKKIGELAEMVKKVPV